MSNDLISREALLTELRNYPYVVDFNKVLEIIHNAPTVNTKVMLDGEQIYPKQEAENNEV